MLCPITTPPITKRRPGTSACTSHPFTNPEIHRFTFCLRRGNLFQNRSQRVCGAAQAQPPRGGRHSPAAKRSSVVPCPRWASTALARAKSSGVGHLEVLRPQAPAGVQPHRFHRAGSHRSQQANALDGGHRGPMRNICGVWASHLSLRSPWRPRARRLGHQSRFSACQPACGRADRPRHRSPQVSIKVSICAEVMRQRAASCTSAVLRLRAARQQRLQPSQHRIGPGGAAALHPEERDGHGRPENGHPPPPPPACPTNG